MTTKNDNYSETNVSETKKKFEVKSVQTYGKKKTATAVAHCKEGKGLIHVNGSPISLITPEVLRYKLLEPIRIIGTSKLKNIDIRIRVSGGGSISRVYAIRQAMAKAVIAFYQKYEDEHTKRLMRASILKYDRTLLVADPRRCEPKKFGGKGSRSRYQKSYR